MGALTPLAPAILPTPTVLSLACPGVPVMAHAMPQVSDER